MSVRGGVGVYCVQIWNSESCAAGQLVFAVTVARQYRWVDAGKVKVTVLLAVGEKVYAAAAFTVVKVLPSVDPSSDKVWSRAPQEAGNWSTTRLAD